MRISLPFLSCAVIFSSIVLSLSGAPKIGVLLKGRSSPFWLSVEKQVIAASHQLGVDVVVKMPLTELDVSVQIQLLNSLVTQGASAIVIAPINKDALAEPIAMAASRGVKIVVIDTPISGNPAPVFVGTDQEAAGLAAGKLLASLIADDEEVSIFRHSQTSGATMARETGALMAFRKVHPTSTVNGDIYASSDTGEEERQSDLLLNQHPRVKAILASGTPGTLAMLKVLKKRNLARSIKLVGFGFNLSPEVANAIDVGDLSGWIAQLPKEIAVKAIAAAVSLLKDEPVPLVIHTDFVVITKVNLHDPAVQELLEP